VIIMIVMMTHNKALKEANKALRPSRRRPWIVRLGRAWWELIKEWRGER